MLKPETRILVSSCIGELCCGYVIRGVGVDGAVIGMGCEGLCSRLVELGYMGELRFYYGSCCCGLKKASLDLLPHQLKNSVGYYLALSSSVCERLNNIIIAEINFIGSSTPSD